MEKEKEKEEIRESPRGRSQLSLFNNCQRKWAFKYVKGWKVPSEGFGPLIFGHVIHEAQEAMYSNRSKEAALAKIEEIMPKPKEGSYAFEDVQEFRKKVDLSFEKWYTELGENDLKNNQILAVEKELEIDLGSYKMTVRLDRLLRDGETKEIFINDTKTTGWSYDNTMTNYMRHDQPKLYIAAVMQNYPEFMNDFAGWRTDVLYSKKAPRSPGGYSIKVGRSPIVRFTNDELHDVLVSYAGIVDDIQTKLAYVGKEPLNSLFPANYDRCYDYNRPCPYLNVCPIIDRQEEPPANLELDPWLAKGTVLDSFKEA